MTEKSDDAAIAKANLVEHLKNIDAACDDARLSAVEKIRRGQGRGGQGARLPKAPVVIMEATLTVSKEHATPAEVVPRQNSATTHAAAPLAYASAALPRLAARGTGNGIKPIRPPPSPDPG